MALPGLRIPCKAGTLNVSHLGFGVQQFGQFRGAAGVHLTPSSYVDRSLAETCSPPRAKDETQGTHSERGDTVAINPSPPHLLHRLSSSPEQQFRKRLNIFLAFRRYAV